MYIHVCLYGLKLSVNASCVNYVEECEQTYNIEKNTVINCIYSFNIMCVCHLIVMETLSFSTYWFSFMCLLMLCNE